MLGVTWTVFGELSFLSLSSPLEVEMAFRTKRKKPNMQANRQLSNMQRKDLVS